MMRQALRPALVVAAAAAGACAAPAVFAADYATVVSSAPVIVSVPVRRQVCSDSRQVVQQAPSGAGALIGAIAGGVIGNSVGGGFGRAAATGLGVVAGSAIGNQVEADTSPVSEVPVRRCQTVTAYEDRTVGYDVMYDYAGQRYSTRMARDPGQRFAVSVQPADAAGGALPAPVNSASVPFAPQDDAAPPVYASAPAQSVYYQSLPPAVYYTPAPYSPYYWGVPAISFGIGYYGGWRGGRHWR